MSWSSGYVFQPLPQQNSHSVCENWSPFNIIHLVVSKWCWNFFGLYPVNFSVCSSDWKKKKKLTSKECYQTMPLKYSGKSFGFCKLISVTSQKTRLGQLYHRACPFSRPSESILALQCLDIGIAPCLLWMTLLLCVSQSTTLALLFPVCVVLFLLSLRQGLLLVQRHIVSRMTPWRGFGYSLENMVSSYH